MMKIKKFVFLLISCLVIGCTPEPQPELYPYFLESIEKPTQHIQDISGSEMYDFNFYQEIWQMDSDTTARKLFVNITNVNEDDQIICVMFTIGNETYVKEDVMLVANETVSFNVRNFDEVYLEHASIDITVIPE